MRKADQLVARGERRLVHGAGHQVGELRAAGDAARAAARESPSFTVDLLDRHAERLGRRLRQDRVGALAHVDARCSRPRPCRRRGCAPAPRPACGAPDRCRRRRPSRSAGCRRASSAAAGLRFAQPKASAPAAKASRSCRVDHGFLGMRILLGIVQQPDRQRIDADLIGELVDRAFDAEGARVLARRAQARPASPYSPARRSGATRNWASHT